MSPTTAKQYSSRLVKFERFLLNEYKENLDGLIAKLKRKLRDPYEVLTSYCINLQGQNLSTVTLKYNIGIAKNFLEFNDVEISPRKFKIKVRLPKVVRRNKEALSKEEIIDILNTCSNIRLKTFVMFLASTGCRAGEAVSIRLKDLDFDSKPSKVFLRGEFTKTKIDRVVFLTDELVNQLKSWIDFKYRRRRICSKDKGTGKCVTEYRTPTVNEYDLIFSARNNEVDHRSIYSDLCHFFERTLDRMGKGDREDGNERRRQITLHSFRRFVKTTISDLGYQDFSEFMIGHAGSTYWRKKDSEKGDLFKKVEPYLTYLTVHSLERQGADIQSKIEELELINVSLRERDKMKDDIISGLSDKLITLSERMEAIERIRIS
jgi:integrase